MFARARIEAFGNMAGPGTPVFAQLLPLNNTTAGNATLTAAEILSGWLRRSGPTAGFTDTFPTVDSVIQAARAAGVSPSVGDCFQLIYQNTTAQAMTYAAGTGFVSGTGTLDCAASSTRVYFITFLSTLPQTILVGNNTNGSATLTGFTAAQLANVMPGMGVSGTGVPSGAVVLGVIPGDGTNNTSTGGRVVLDQNCTSTNSNIPFTFFPRARIDSIGRLTA